MNDKKVNNIIRILDTILTIIKMIPKLRITVKGGTNEENSK